MNTGAGPGGSTYLKPVMGWIDQVRFGWDAVNTRWQAWFSGYSHAEQQALMKKIGIDEDALRAGLQMGVLVVFICLFSGVSIWLLFKAPSPGKTDPVARCYERFCRKLARQGILRKAGQGPLDFARMVGSQRPDLGPAAAEITDLYLQLRYSKSAGTGRLPDLKSKVRAFEPKKSG